MRRVVLVWFFLSGRALLCEPASAVAQGASPVLPAWDQKLTCGAGCVRFQVLSTWNNDAVLDRETGLVWQRAPGALKAPQTLQQAICKARAIGSRFGWRLPTQVELMTLGTVTNTNDEFHLPGGHPFTVSVADGTEFWTTDRHPEDSEEGEGVDFRPVAADFSILAGIAPIGGPSATAHRAWCVRGPS